MPAYDAEQFFPPAPVALVSFRNATTKMEASNVPMLLDSGADATMVPEQIVASLGVDASLSAQFEIIGVEGKITFARAVSLELLFLGRRFRGESLLTPNEYGILGRNILNRIPLLLDGPKLIWDEARR
jgi:predicted aspartyl protease